MIPIVPTTSRRLKPWGLIGATVLILPIERSMGQSLFKTAKNH